jgi:hypothetical protein
MEVSSRRRRFRSYPAGSWGCLDCAPLRSTRPVVGGGGTLKEQATPLRTNVVSTEGPLWPEVERPPQTQYPRTDPTGPGRGLGCAGASFDTTRTEEKAKACRALPKNLTLGAEVRPALKNTPPQLCFTPRVPPPSLKAFGVIRSSSKAFGVIRSSSERAPQGGTREKASQCIRPSTRTTHSLLHPDD